MFKPRKIPAPPLEEGPAGARRRLAQLLMVARSPDPPGAFAAIAEDDGLVSSIVDWPRGDAEAHWDQLVSALFDLAEAQRCLRCGTCCRVSSPTLYLEDLELIKEGRIARQGLFTLRAGEMVHSARLGERFVLDQDLVKLKERPQGGCMLLDDHLCASYDDRPLQCRHLECWSGRHDGDLEERPRLGRRDLYTGDETALALIGEYDVKLPADAFTKALEAARSGDDEAAKSALEHIERDHRLRLAIAERYGYSMVEQDLLFGRDAVQVVRSFGLVLRLDDPDSPSFVEG